MGSGVQGRVGKVKGSVGKQWEREWEIGEREGYWKMNSKV